MGSISSTNITLVSGSANEARVEVGSGSNAGGLNSANAGSDIAIWAGSSHANRTTAAFRVTAGGAMTCTNGNFTGTIDANSGTIGALNIDGALTIVSGGSITVGDTSITTTGINLTAGTGDTSKIKWSSSAEIVAGTGGTLFLTGGSGGVSITGDTLVLTSVPTDTGSTLYLGTGSQVFKDSSSRRFKERIAPWQPQF